MSRDVSFEEGEFWPWSKSGEGENKCVQFPVMSEITAQEDQPNDGEANDKNVYQGTPV